MCCSEACRRTGGLSRPAKKYHVDLSAPERRDLEQMLRRGTHSVRTLTHAGILLKADEGLGDEEIAEAVDTSGPTVEPSRLAADYGEGAAHQSGFCPPDEVAGR